SVLRNPTGRPIASEEFVECKRVFYDEILPLVSVRLQCPLVSASGEVAVLDNLPVEGVDFLLGNDLAGERVYPDAGVVWPGEDRKDQESVCNV
ncbi:hypothetical protein, partial [Klebsiella pneumoniae]|uniref:hypothetical protein n=1 Tax=Klebsiella pneumoniae TaxID=573 RepID=UPI003EB7A5D8